MSSSHLAACCVAALLVAAPAFADASSEQYRGCDGYGAASSEGDGMTEHATFFFIFNPIGYGNTDRANTKTGNAAAADCDAALSDLPPVHWMRKVSLLRARAMHRLEAGNTAAALEDLDLAEATAKNSTDPLYLRSLGWGLKVARAYALRVSGDQAKASVIAMQALAERPLTRQSVYSVLQAMGPGANPADIDAVKKDIARLVPTQVDDLFLHALEEGRMADVIALYPNLTPPTEIGDIYLPSADLQARQWRDYRYAQLFKSTRAGIYAYALAATGQADAARTALQAEKTRLAADTAPPPPLSAKDAKDSDLVAVHQGTIDIRARSAAEGNKFLEEWSQEVDLRILIAQGKIAEAEKSLQSVKLLRSWASVELLDSLEARLPKHPQTHLSAALRAQLATEDPYVPMTSPEKLLRSLPEAETKHRIPDYSEASKPWFGDGPKRALVSGEGYRVGVTGPDGVTVVRFNGGMAAPSALVEEMALFRAADFALSSGKKGFVIVDREDIKSTVTSTYYGVPTRTDPMGFEVALSVVLVDPAAPQAPYQSAPWRIIDAQAVEDALAPLGIKTKAKATGSPK